MAGQYLFCILLILVYNVSILLGCDNDSLFTIANDEISERKTRINTSTEVSMNEEQDHLTETRQIISQKEKKWKKLAIEHGLGVHIDHWSSNLTALVVRQNEMTDITSMTATLDNILNSTNEAVIIATVGNPLAVQLYAFIQRRTSCCTHAYLSTGSMIHICNNSPQQVASYLEQLVKLTNNFHDIEKDSSSIWVPRIFASAARPTRSHKHAVHHDPHQLHGAGKHRKARVNYRQLELLHIKRMKEQSLKKQKSASEILNMPIYRRKLFCKYRKSCYNTGIVPETWDIRKILPFAPSFIKTQTRKVNMSTADLADMIEDSDSQEEVKESEIQLLCRYRKSCYKEVGAEIERRDVNIRVVRVLSAKKPIIAFPPSKKKTIAEIARIALKKIEEQQKLAAQRPIPAKVIVDKKLNQIEEEMKKRLACHYRKSCYETGNPPEISHTFANAFNKIHHFMLESMKMPIKTDLLHKTFKELEEDQKKLYCKYRKSCYETGEKPVIHEQHIFTYLHLLQKHEQLVPLELRCKYRKSCYETGILKLFAKQVEEKNEENKAAVPKIETIYDMRLMCKYRKSCYREKAQESANETRTAAEYEMYNEIIENLDEDEQRKGYKQNVSKISAIQALTNLTTTAKVADEEKSQAKKKEAAESKGKKKERKSSKIKPLEDKTEVNVKDAQLTKRKKIRAVATVAKRKTPKAARKPGPTPTPQDRLYFKKATAEKQVEEKPKKSRETISRDIEGKPKSAKSKVLKEEQTTKPQKTKKTETDIIVKRELGKETKDDQLVKMSSSASRRAKKPKKRDMTESAQEKTILNNDSVTSNKSREQELPASDVSTPMQVKKLVSTLTNLSRSISTSISETKEMRSRKVNIADENLTPAQAKLICKYRKSCYEKGELPIIMQAQTIMHLVEKDKEHMPLQLRCKYRKSCYETGVLPENLNAQQTVHVIAKKYKNKEMRCKYRKSCYETGKIPKIERSMFEFSMIRNLIKMYEKEKKNNEQDTTLEEKKLRCKYRKSCYETGKLPPILNQTVDSIASTIKDHYASPQLKCKYRISCYVNLKLDIELDKQRKKEERKPQEGVTESKITPEGNVKEKETKKEKRDSEEGEEARARIKRKKEKPAVHDEADLDYLQIQLLETKKRKLTSQVKLKCKYRRSCYDGKPLYVVIKEEQIEKEKAVNIKDFRRANGAICNIYYISCRKMAGLPVKERVPIGPNGRRLCRKKKKSEILG